MLFSLMKLIIQLSGLALWKGMYNENVLYKGKGPPIEELFL